MRATLSLDRSKLNSVGFCETTSVSRGTGGALGEPLQLRSTSSTHEPEKSTLVCGGYSERRAMTGSTRLARRAAM
jgi:hypothetical protein